jgi:D-glycero-alpha-D-manno-heptose-7-phosphate kinase
MSFFGGGTDFPAFYDAYGGSVISTTIDKYCYVTVRRLPAFFDYRNELIYSKVERVGMPDEINHPLIRNAMRHTNTENIRLTYDADLPARSGLGTSSSFAVGMLNAFHVLAGRRESKRNLADDAIYVERVLCAEAGGVQDQIAAAYGGFNRIDFFEGGYSVAPMQISWERRNALNDNLLLYFSGFSRYSFELAEKQAQAIKDKTPELLEMINVVDEAQAILCSPKICLSEFGKLLDRSWKLKRGLTDRITTDHIDAMYAHACRSGALGGKLLGAGGGGFLLFYVEKERQDAFKAAFSDYIHIPFRFETAGAVLLQDGFGQGDAPSAN